MKLVPKILCYAAGVCVLILAAAFFARLMVPKVPTVPGSVPALVTATSPAPETLGICYDPESGSLTSAYRKGDTVLCPYGQFISVHPAKNRADADPFYGGTGP